MLNDSSLALPSSLAARVGHSEIVESVSLEVLSFDRIDVPDASRVGNKGANLVLLRKAGLPVPPGYCIPVEAHARYVERGEISDVLLAGIKEAKRILGGKIAIRSSATCEDSPESSMAGVFESHYVTDDNSIGASVERILRQARSADVENFMTLHGKSSLDVRMAIVIQRLIEPELSGVMYTGVNGRWLLVQYIDGFGTRLVDGKNRGSALLIGSDGRIEESTGYDAHPFPAAAIKQVRRHALAIEAMFSYVPMDIEFAYCDGVLYIVQARPLTTDLGRVQLRERPIECLEIQKENIRRLMAREKQQLGTRTAIFSDANYSELLPKPTEMDIGLHQYVWGGSDGIPGAKQLGHAQMGYLVGPEATGIISYIGGRTYSSIARYAALYHIGFPASKKEYFATLVEEYLTTVNAEPEKGAYPQMGLFLQDPTLEDMRARYGERAEEYFREYSRFTQRMKGFAQTFLSEFQKERLPATTVFIETMAKVDVDAMHPRQQLEHATAILEHIRTFSDVDFVKAARLGFYYSQRLLGLLQHSLGHSAIDARKLYSRLNQGLDGSAITGANIAIARAASEEEALRIAQELIGHFSTGEMLEIRHSPMRDMPDALRTYVHGIRQTGTYSEQFQKQRSARLQAVAELLDRVSGSERIELEEVIKASQTYMALRETAKYLFTKEYVLLRDALVAIERKTGLGDGDVFFLYPRELASLVADPASITHLIRSRKQSFKNYEELHMPNVIRWSDVDSIHLRSGSDADFAEATGSFLAEGPSVEGQVLNLDEFATLAEAAVVLEGFRADSVPVILVATQMNLSHDPIISQSAGLVIENSGIVAHGAQRARELGKGAIGGIKTRQLKTGMRVFFDPINQLVRRLQ